MIGENSRYRIVESFAIKDAEGKERIMLGRREITKETVETVLHIIKEGDRLDLLAYQYYGDPSLWWIIMDNNDFLKDPLDLSVGQEILVPILG